MDTIFEIVQKPWPWYVAGPLIGCTVPLLLLLGNKSFGISSSLRHMCAACLPAGIPFFQYNWRKETWNLLFVLGIVFGGCIAANFLSNNQPIVITSALRSELASYGVSNISSLVPTDLFSFVSLFSLKGFSLMVIGGFMVGFGTRYAGGCTSGHAIFGISALQWPSLVATCSFLAGGWFSANYVLPYLLNL